MTTLSPPDGPFSIKKTFDKHPIKYKLVGKKSTIDGPEWTYEMAFDPNKVDKKYLKDAAFTDAYSDDEIDEKQIRIFKGFKDVTSWMCFTRIYIILIKMNQDTILTVLM